MVEQKNRKLRIGLYEEPYHHDGEAYPLLAPRLEKREAELVQIINYQQLSKEVAQGIDGLIVHFGISGQIPEIRKKHSNLKIALYSGAIPLAEFDGMGIAVGLALGEKPDFLLLPNSLSLDKFLDFLRKP